jgi:hypothetical protein
VCFRIDLRRIGWSSDNVYVRISQQPQLMIKMFVCHVDSLCFGQPTTITNRRSNRARRTKRPQPCHLLCLASPLSRRTATLVLLWPASQHTTVALQRHEISAQIGNSIPIRSISPSAWPQDLATRWRESRFSLVTCQFGTTSAPTWSDALPSLLCNRNMALGKCLTRWTPLRYVAVINSSPLCTLQVAGLTRRSLGLDSKSNRRIRRGDACSA